MSGRKRILFSLAAALLFLALLEAVLRLTIPLDKLLFSWERTDSLLAIRASGTVQTVPAREHHMSDGPYPWTMRTNGQGLRESAETPARTPADTWRILALGDSWVFGYSVDQGRTMPDQLEQILPRRLGRDKVEVLNGGLPGGSAFDMLVRWQELSQGLELDGLLLGIPHNLSRQWESADRRQKWYASVKGAPFIDLRIYLVMRRLMAPVLRPRYAAPRWTREEALPAIEDLTALVKEARGRGLQVWAVEWPNEMDSALNGTYQPSPQWREALEPLGVIFTGHALNTRACWGFKDHGHPSEAGQRTMAEVVAEAILTGKSHSIGTEPRCEDVPGAGPGKAGYTDWPAGQ